MTSFISEMNRSTHLRHVTWVVASTIGVLPLLRGTLECDDRISGIFGS